MPRTPEPMKATEPEPEPEKEIAEFNAQHAIEEALAAEAEAAEAAERAEKLAEEAEDTGEPRARRCPNCRERMVKHDNPADEHKYGCWHCSACGVCWDRNKPRAGTPAPMTAV